MHRAVALLTAACALTLPATAGALGFPDREADPVVVEGSDVPSLLGADPGRIVAFAWDGRWRQVPVQVDERAVIDYVKVRGRTTSDRPFSHLAYTDPGTLAGPDPQPALDGDDEIALMASDSGRRTEDPGPDGVRRESRVRLRVSDPLNPGVTRFVYLFRSGKLDPSAGRSYVDYDFKLLSGDYPSTYDFDGEGNVTNGGPPANREDSVVTTDRYRLHLLSRWITDELGFRSGGATGADLLDGDKVQVNFGCGRAEVTFARGGGGFIANKSGPVRAIRSYVGANSGIYTQRDHLYYRESEVTAIDLRVHSGINVISQFLDYSPAAVGMTYRSSRAPGGVTVDGIADPQLETGAAVGPPVEWEQVTGPQGTLSIVSRIDTDIPGVVRGSYYQDALSPSTTQCDGYADDRAYAASGTAASGTGVNTDPTLGTANRLSTERTTFFSEPGGDAALAARRAQQVDAPLAVRAAADTGEATVEIKAPDRYRVEVGVRERLWAKVINRSGWAAGRVELCIKGPRRLIRGTKRCATIKNLGAHKQRTVRAPLRLRSEAADRAVVRARFVAKGPGIARAEDLFQIEPE